MNLCYPVNTGEIEEVEVFREEARVVAGDGVWVVIEDFLSLEVVAGADSHSADRLLSEFSFSHGANLGVGSPGVNGTKGPFASLEKINRREGVKRQSVQVGLNCRLLEFKYSSKSSANSRQISEKLL